MDDSQMVFNGQMDLEDSFNWDYLLPDSSLGGPTLHTGTSGAQPVEDCAIEDCDSDCEDSCQSQCGETGHGVCCDDKACGSAELCVDDGCTNPCTDASCQVEPEDGPAITDGDRKAAAALASIGDNQFQMYDASMMNSHDAHGHHHPGSMNALGLQGNMYDSMPMDFSMTDFTCSQMWPMNNGMQLAAHILQYHAPNNEYNHVRPCIADNPSQFMSTCSLPRCADADTVAEGSFPHQYHDHNCGFQVQDPATFANHVWEEHRDVLMPNAFFFNPDQQSQMLEGMNDYSVNLPTMPTLAHRTCAEMPPSQRFSASASPMTNLSSGTTLPTTPTSISTPPSLELEQPSPKTAAARRSRSGDETPINERKPQTMGKDDQYQCRWLHGGKRMCGQIFDDHKDLQKHCKEDHLAELKKPPGGFVCPWDGCPRTAGFEQKSKLDRHLQTHTGFKPVECPTCGLKLSAKQALDQHMRIHTGDKPWKCRHPGCDRAFPQQSAYTMHMRTHTGEKPLQCDVCGKKFAESSNLSKHRRIHNVKGQHSCKLCGKDFHRLDQLRRHMSTNHKDRPREVEEFLRKVQKNKPARIKKGSKSQSIKTPQDWELDEAVPLGGLEVSDEADTDTAILDVDSADQKFSMEEFLA